MHGGSSMTTPASSEKQDVVPSGIAGLDTVLCGGFARERVHLIEGAPGSGKTTLGLQFLMDGVARVERGLYITLSESKKKS